MLLILLSANLTISLDYTPQLVGNKNDRGGLKMVFQQVLHVGPLIKNKSPDFPQIQDLTTVCEKVKTEVQKSFFEKQSIYQLSSIITFNTPVMYSGHPAAHIHQLIEKFPHCAVSMYNDFSISNFLRTLCIRVLVLDVIR